jgi:hypothetical protein
MDGSASWEQLRGGEVWQLFARKIGRISYDSFMKTPTLSTNCVHSSLRRSALLLFLLACFALLPRAQAVSPPPDGGYPGGNTAEGEDALLNLTNGRSNTAVGNNALLSDTNGSFNTAVGGSALSNNTTGEANTAVGNNRSWHSTLRGTITQLSEAVR